MCLLMLKTWKKKKKVTTVNKRIVPIEHFEVFMIASFKNSRGHSARFRCYTDYWRDTKLPKNVQPWSITLLQNLNLEATSELNPDPLGTVLIQICLLTCNTEVEDECLFHLKSSICFSNQRPLEALLFREFLKRSLCVKKMRDAFMMLWLLPATMGCVYSLRGLSQNLALGDTRSIIG